jgi:hypothetical protein
MSKSHLVPATTIGPLKHPKKAHAVVTQNGCCFSADIVWASFLRESMFSNSERLSFECKKSNCVNGGVNVM